jgi:hypothetical protein
MLTRIGLLGLAGAVFTAGLAATAPASMADLVHGLRDSLLSYLTIPLGTVPLWESP